MLTDRYAYNNAWRDVHPAVKGILAGFGLTASLAASSPVVPLLTLVVMAGVTVIGARVPAGVCLRLVLVPAGFLLAGVAGLAFSFAGGELPLFDLPWSDLTVYLSFTGLRQAALMLARALGAVASLSLLALTTPLTEIVGLLRRLRVPHLLLELIVLAYRQLFTFVQVAHEIRVAQLSRLGDATTGTRFRSLAALGASLFMRMHQRTRQLHRAMASRGFEGDLHWLEREQPLPARPLALAVASGSVLVILALTVRG